MSILADFSIRKKHYKNIYPWSDGNAQYNGGEVYYRGFSRDVIPPYPYPPWAPKTLYSSFIQKTVTDPRLNDVTTIAIEL